MLHVQNVNKVRITNMYICMHLLTNMHKNAVENTHTAPFLKPLRTARADLYLCCCRRLLTVYNKVLKRSEAAMTLL